MLYEVVGPRKAWLDIIISLLVVFPAWPKVPGDGHKALPFLDYIKHLPCHEAVFQWCQGSLGYRVIVSMFHSPLFSVMMHSLPILHFL